ncbi:MAG TPA: BMC domain-containing protein [Haliangium sp.]|nr:BMC domain-containing protein [Haliangium sp.]
MASTPDEAPDRCALGILELGSIARGVIVADATVKRAPSLLLMSRPVSGGKHLIMMRGQVAEIEESMEAGRRAAAAALLDSLELPYAHEQLWPLLDQPMAARGWQSDPTAESVGIVETETVCAAVGAADVAVKTAPVILRDMRLAVGIGGKAFFTFTGELADVEAAADAARAHAGARLIAVEIVPRPADEIRGRLIF